MLLQSTGIGQEAIRLGLILQPRTSTEDEYMSCGTAGTVAQATRTVAAARMVKREAMYPAIVLASFQPPQKRNTVCKAWTWPSLRNNSVL